jgi:hypothetical protein
MATDGRQQTVNDGCGRQIHSRKYPPGKYVIGYDYFPPSSSFPLHYFSEEFVVESETTTELVYTVKN